MDIQCSAGHPVSVDFFAAEQSFVDKLEHNLREDMRLNAPKTYTVITLKSPQMLCIAFYWQGLLFIFIVSTGKFFRVITAEHAGKNKDKRKVEKYLAEYYSSAKKRFDLLQ